MYINMSKVSFIGEHKFIIDGVEKNYNVEVTREMLLALNESWLKSQRKKSEELKSESDC